MDLAPSNDTTDVQCLVQISPDSLMFFNADASGLYTWDGSSLGVHRSPEDLNGDVPDESNNFDNCDGVATESGFAYFILRSGETNVNFVYRTEAADASNNAFVQFNGANALAADDSTVYIGSVSALGEHENGVYEVANDLSGSVSEYVINGDVNPETLNLQGDDSTLYGYSSSFGSGDFESTVFTLDVSASSPTFTMFADPYQDGSPLNQAGDEITDLERITFDGTDYLVVFNNAFDGPNGEEWGTIRVSDQTVDLLFNESDLTANLPVEEYTGGGAPMAATDNGEVFAASVRDFGASDFLASVRDAPPLPVEMTGFDAVQNGSSVELTWQTASETNNAGFRVQHQTESGSWSKLGFVESNAPSGTATEAQSYRYKVDRELDPGTHRFRLTQVDLDGSTHPSKVVEVNVQMDQVVSLSAPAPNPTSGQVSLSFAVKEKTDATLSVYNVLGQKVETLYDGRPRAEQMRSVSFDTSDLPSGVYVVRLQAGDQTQTQRLTVVR